MRVKEIGKILSEIARVDCSDNDTKEIVYDREPGTVRKPDRNGIIEVVTEAAHDPSQFAMTRIQT